MKYYRWLGLLLFFFSLPSCFAFSTTIKLNENSEINYTHQNNLTRLIHSYNKGAFVMVLYNYDIEAYILVIRNNHPRNPKSVVLEAEWKDKKLSEHYIDTKKYGFNKFTYQDIEPLLLQCEALLQPFLDLIAKKKETFNAIGQRFDHLHNLFIKRVEQKETELMSFYSDEYQDFLSTLRIAGLDNRELQALLGHSLHRIDSQFFLEAGATYEYFFANLFRIQGEWRYENQKVLDANKDNAKKILDLHQFDYLSFQKRLQNQ